MLRCAKVVAALALACVWTLPRFARADSADDKAARAELLFREAEAFFAAGEIAGACAKLAESHRLDPGIGTLINLGLCHERQGRTATAIAELREALVAATAKDQAERVRLLNEEIARLEPRLTKIVLVRDAGPAVDVYLDGARVPANAFEIAFPIDPGMHSLVVTATGMRRLSVPLSVSDAPTVQPVYLPPLEVETPLAPPLPASTPPTTHPARTVGFVLLGVAAVGLGVGTTLGVVALSDKSRADERCVPGVVKCASPDGVAANDRAQTEATIASFVFATAIAAGIGGAYLVLTAPRTSTSARIAPRAHARGGGLALEATW